MIDEIYQPPPNRTIQVIVAVVVMLGLSAVLLPRAFAIIGESTGNTEAKELLPIPVLDGKDETHAVNDLEAAGFRAEITKVQNTRVPPGVVFDQSPVGGVMAERNTTVTLVVSAGTGFVIMPQLEGSLGQDLESQLERYGLVLGEVTSMRDETTLAGEVIAQYPDSGIEIALGTAVDVVMSEGPGPRTIPATQGMSQAEATRLLIAAGFTVEHGTAYSSSISRGTVISTTPASGTEAEFGSAVTVVVSAGAAPPPPTVDEDDDDDDGDSPRPPRSTTTTSTTAPRSSTSN